MTALAVHPPACSIGSRRSMRLIERNLHVYKHGWLVDPVGLLRAALLPARIGFGLGRARRDRAGPGGEPIPYQLFVAPRRCSASAAMNGAINESTFNFFFKLNYNKTFVGDPGDAAVAGRHRRRAS